MALAKFVDHPGIKSLGRSIGTGKDGSPTSAPAPANRPSRLKIQGKSLLLRRFCFTAE
jgi:hypothetical protein